MNAKWNRVLRNEQGITALETAIILIAFVVVAAIFAFTVLTTGTFLTERSKEAAYAGLQEVRGSMELKGSVVLESTGTYIVFNLATVSGGSSVDVSKVKITYRDSALNTDLSYDNTGSATPVQSTWSVVNPVTSAAITILDTGSLAKFRVAPPTGALSSSTTNKTFGLEIKPTTGGVILLERTTPARIDAVTDLH